MKTIPLHPRFGVEVQGVDLRAVTAERHYPEIRALFERHSLLLFRDQALDEETQNDFALLFGPLEDRDADAARGTPRPRPPVPRLSNRNTGGGLHAAESERVLNLIAYQLGKRYAQAYALTWGIATDRPDEDLTQFKQTGETLKGKRKRRKTATRR